MIHIDRGRVPAPPSLRSAKATAARKRIEEFIALPEKTRAQRESRLDYSLYRAPDVVDALLNLFHHKCAYCETPLADRRHMDVDAFRPRARAMNLDGTLDADGYWWLAYEWDNLFPTCGRCNRFKGTRFPVAGTRVTRGAKGTALAAERPLLIDPCQDNPEKHLVFAEDGKVASETEQGRVTIDVLGLNRETLVRQRRESLAALHAEIERVRKSAKRDPKLVERLAGDSVPYAGARRQFLRTWVEAGPAAPRAASKADMSALPHISEQARKKTVDEFDKAQRAQESYSIVDEGTKSHYFVRTRLIDRIEIRNFRPIENLTLQFAEPDLDVANLPATAATSAPQQARWLMLLGENGSGKSSVLQAVALALIGEDWRNRLQLDASRYLRRGAQEGFVKVYLTGVDQPIELKFSRDSKRFVSEPKEPKVLLLGYGSTRLLPRRGATPVGSYDFARIDNLFDPFVPLNDAAVWLGGIDESTFDTVARALRAILQLTDDDKLVRASGGVEAEVFGNRVQLDELSDGYQSVVALATDIMRVMLKRWPAMEVAEGIVVLDEIGSHLHPRWRMRMVDALRRTFPRVQFLASTHDPLCLRGLAAGEVVVMRRDAAQRVVALTDLPPIAGLRVDQLLTSEYFGLNITIDPEMEDLFSEYYKLLALRNPGAQQKKRIGELRAVLEKFRLLGANQRERLMLDAIDQYLAEEKATPTPGNVQLKAATKTKLARIWATTPAAAVKRSGTRA